MDVGNWNLSQQALNIAFEGGWGSFLPPWFSSQHNEWIMEKFPLYYIFVICVSV